MTATPSRPIAAPWRCRTLVIASGACNVPIVPALSAQLPATITSLTPFQYRTPAQLPAGGVMIVGASATGVQLAREIRASGRKVLLCVGEHVRLPRVYRGRDITWWMDAMGMMDVRYDEIEDLERARRLPSLQLIGTPERATIDLNALRAAGVEFVGKLVAVDGARVKFSGSLPNCCALADLKMNRLLESIDSWIERERDGGSRRCSMPLRADAHCSQLTARCSISMRVASGR